MNISRLSFLFILPLFLFCNTNSAFAYIEKDTAIIRVMNKAAGKTQQIPAEIDKKIKVDGLEIIVRNCKQTDPFDAENFFVFLEIYTKSDGRIFSGWMNRNEPGENPLQNETYDVWIEKCE